MEKLLPEEHLMLASVKRVKALILEEIALDTMPNSSGMIKIDSLLQVWVLLSQLEIFDYGDCWLVQQEPGVSQAL
jgi:hypothetical protein